MKNILDIGEHLPIRESGYACKDETDALKLKAILENYCIVEGPYTAEEWEDKCKAYEEENEA